MTPITLLLSASVGIGVLYVGCEMISGGYEVLVMNKSVSDLQNIRLCIQGGNCFSGSLEKGRSVWLSTDSAGKEIHITIESENHDFAFPSCQLPSAKRDCAYEAFAGEKGIVCPYDVDDCISL